VPARRLSTGNPAEAPIAYTHVVTRGALSILGVVLVLVGALFIGQGTNVIHGSSMSGHGGYAGLGAVLLVGGVALLVWSRRARSDPTV
jgi:hypothetical protein